MAQKGTEEGGGGLRGGGRKSDRRGAEIGQEGGGNQTEVVRRSSLHFIRLRTRHVLRQAVYRTILQITDQY